MTEIFDELYDLSRKGHSFKNLMDIITSDNNILLAYRNIKGNQGSHTCGTDGLNIELYNKLDKNELISLVKRKLANYNPKSVKRVMIPKGDGKFRPLGIPCMIDRIIQQCIKQVLEPICEAKFHNHSYGFRPNRACVHAIARANFLVNKAKLHYVVDVDIKSFFDNVDHAKLKKQIWSLGINDKNLIAVLGKILKSEIQGEGIPTKGTPQGGIISPLLSNIVLNELDWWVSSQWETFETRHNYTMMAQRSNRKVIIDQSNRNRALRKNSKLKEMYIVRYADDFKIFCRDHKTAQKIYHAVKQWLKERLNLDISPDKSKITNLRKNSSDFLGFRLKVWNKGKKQVLRTRMSEKAKKKVKEEIREQIRLIFKKRDQVELVKYNAIILGVHNYYKYANCISIDLREIYNSISTVQYNKLRRISSKKITYSESYLKLYGNYKIKPINIKGITLFPITGCSNRNPLCFNQDICNYTESGREIIHDKLTQNSANIIQKYLNVGYSKRNSKLFDYSVSLLAGQHGNCAVTKLPLAIGNMELHHKIPKSMGGTDDYSNLIWVLSDVHKLIHARKKETIEKYLTKIDKTDYEMRKINSLRKLVGNSIIIL